MNISGISGVATKTSYAMFLLHALFESGTLVVSSGREGVFLLKYEPRLIP